MAEYVNLHQHSIYSIRDSIAKIDDIVAKAVQHKLPGVALTDHGTMGGALSLYKAAKEHGIKPILGCLLPEQEIVTDKGIKLIKDIRIGDNVLTHKGRFMPVLATMKRKHSGKLYSIELNNRYNRILKLTDEHPILVSDNNKKLSWLKPGEIKFGKSNKHGGTKSWNSYVVFPKLQNYSEYQSISLLNHIPNELFGSTEDFIVKVKKSNKFDRLEQWKDIKTNLLLNEDFAYFLGLFAAEGYLGKNDDKLNGSIIFSFHIDEQKYIQFITDYVANNFNLKTNISLRPEKNQADIYFSSLPLSYLLLDLIGDGAENKNIPSYIFYSPLNVRNNFLRGVLDGDGKHSEKYNDLHIISKKLSWGVKILLVNQDQWASPSIIDNNFKKTSYNTPINISPSYRRIMFDDNYIYKPIKNITCEDAETDVYNFQVSEDESYVSDFVLHNCEIYVATRGRRNKEKGVDKYYHLTLLAMNNTGWKNLVRLVSMGYDPENYYYKPRIDRELLSAYNEGLICLSGCIGGNLSNAIMKDLNIDFEDEEGNSTHEHTAECTDHCEHNHNVVSTYKEVVDWHHKVFGDRYYLEVQNHNIGPEDKINDVIFDIAAKKGIKTIATGDTHFVEHEDDKAHDIMLAIRDGITINDEKMKKIKYNGDGYHLMNTKEMLDRFPGHSEAVHNSLEVYERCNLTLSSGSYLPSVASPEEEDKIFIDAVVNGLYRKFGKPVPADIMNRAVEEMEVIIQMGYPSYFLMVSDYVTKAKKSGILVGPGRGSAAGSLVSYVLDITSINPLEYDLSFSRFLNKGRAAVPLFNFPEYPLAKQ